MRDARLRTILRARTSNPTAFAQAAAQRRRPASLFGERGSIDFDDAATIGTLEACGRAVETLARQGLIAMVEPFVSQRVGGAVRNILTPEAMIRASTIAAGLGPTSAYTWLKVPVVDEMERVMSATTLPALILGGETDGDPDAAFERWRRALRLPTVEGLVIGRRLLYPPGDDVAAAVDTAVGLFSTLPNSVGSF